MESLRTLSFRVLDRQLKELCHVNKDSSHRQVLGENMSGRCMANPSRKTQHGLLVWSLMLWGEDEGSAHMPILPSPPRNSQKPTIFALILHYHQIIFIGFTHVWGPIFFHSAQIFFLTSLSLPGVSSIYGFFPSGCQLWILSPPPLSGTCFFRNGVHLELQHALTWLFSSHP